MRTLLARSLPLLACAALLAACSDGAPTASKNSDGVSLSFTTGTGASAARNLSAASAAPTVVLSRVQLVLLRVRLKQAGVSNDSVRVCETQPAACPEFRAGPVLVDLPLKGGVVTPFSTPIPPGSYDRLLFNIRPPQGSDSAAVRFRTANSWPETATIRVQGTYDGAPFDLFLRTAAEMRVPFSPPFKVTAGASQALNVTVAVNTSNWFTSAAGTAIDPRALTSDARLLQKVEENIRASVRAFNDANRTGKDGQQR